MRGATIITIINSQTDRQVVWGADSGVPKELRVGRVPIPDTGRDDFDFGAKMDRVCYVQTAHSGVEGPGESA